MSLFSLDKILPITRTNSINRMKQSATAMNEAASTTVIDIDNIGYVDKSFDSFSFIQEGYDFVLETNAFFNEAERDFYSKILGSYGDDNIINESFGDFFGAIKKIINKFIEWIKKIFKQFAAKLAGLVGSEKYIKKHKTLLYSFSTEDEFEYSGYKYTKIDDASIPRANACDAFGDTSGNTSNPYMDKLGGLDLTLGYHDSTGGTTDINSGEDANTVNTKRKALEDLLKKRNESYDDKVEDFYDAFRGHVIGIDHDIDDTDFSEELFKLFRNDESSESSITIDSNYVTEAYRRFDKYKDTIKQINKTKDAIIKDYQDLEKQLDKLIEYNKDAKSFKVKDVSRDYSRDQIRKLDSAPEFATFDDTGAASNANAALSYSQTAFDSLNLWLKKQSTRVNRMCDIHSRAFSAKLEAAKDCFSQDKKILNKAIQQVIKRSNKNK